MTNFAAINRTTLLALRICSARLDPKVPAEDFAQLVADFRESAENDARGPLGRAVPIAVVDDDGSQCPFCYAQILGPMSAHQCTRKRELGFGTDKLLDELGVIDDKTRSTGAAADDANAEHPSPSAASDTPAAPSTDSCRREAEPTPAPLLDGLSPQGQPAPRQPERSVLSEKSGNTIAAPASSQQPETPLSGSPADDAGTAPAGEVSAGAERSHNGHRMTRQQLAALRSAYDTALAAHGGVLPHGWQKEQARAFGFTTQAIGDRVREWRREPPKRVPDYVAGEELPHTETPACWCRKKPASRDNVWCKLRTIQKPAAQHPALRAPEPRVRRMVGTRY